MTPDAAGVAVTTYPTRGAGERILARAASPALIAVAVATIAAAGLGLRLAGVDFGNPFTYHPDEFIVAKPGMSMAATGGWDPHQFMYPSALMYAEKGVAIAVHALTGAPYEVGTPAGLDGLPVAAPYEAGTDQFDFFLGGRILVAVLGSLTVPITFLAGRAIAGIPGGIAAALVAALAPVAVTNAHFLTPDVPSALAVSVVLLIALRAPNSERALILAGLAAGVAGSTKYNAMAVSVVPVILAITGPWAPWKRIRIAAGVAAAAVVGVFALSPALVVHAGEAAAQLRSTAAAYGASRPGLENGAIYWLRSLWDGGLRQGFVIASIVGIAAAAVRRSRPAFALLAFTLVYYVLVSLPTARYERNLLPLIPSLGLLVGIGLSDLLAYGGTRRTPRALVRLAGAAVIALGTLQAGTADLRWAAAFQRPDTRTIALDWINANIAPGTRIVRDYYTPQPSVERYESAIIPFLSDRSLEWYRAHGVSFVVTSEYTYLRAQGAQAAFYDELLAGPIALDVRPGPATSVSPRIVIVDLR